MNNIQTSELKLNYNGNENYTFRIAEAVIKEGLDKPYEIECICYYTGNVNSPYERGIYELFDRDVVFRLSDPSYSNNLERKLENRYYTGVVLEAIYLGSKELYISKIGEQKYYYKFKLGSQLYRLGYNKSYRIYTEQTVLDVLKHLFERSRGPITQNVDFSRIQNDFSKEEYITQYNESDLEFLLRICSRYGIYISENESGINFYDSLYMSDFSYKEDVKGNDENSKHVTYPYNPSSDNYLSSCCISSIERGSCGIPLWSIYSTVDSCYPEKSLTGISHVYDNLREIDNRNNITTYARHVSFLNPSFIGASSGMDIQYQSTLDSLSSHVNSFYIKARSNIVSLKSNDVITITGVEGKDETYRIIGIKHYFHDKAEQGGRKLEHEPLLYTMYSNELYLIPNTLPYALNKYEKPRAHGVTLGVVVGENDDIDKERNTISVDKYGRVRVKFANMSVQGNYDDEVLSGNRSNGYSCYLRYASPTASNHSGYISVPRVGDEVVISFIDGDPDRPIITGCLYNFSNPSLIQEEIISNRHKTSLSSRTVGVNSEGRNEFTMSNMPNKEEIYLKAEKDYVELVQNDYNQTINHNKTVKVAGAHTENILLSHIQNVGGVKDVNVGGEYLTVVALSKDTVVGLSNTLNVGESNKVNVKMNSSENIGNNKNIEIGGNATETIDKDMTVNVGGISRLKSSSGKIEDIGKNSDINVEGDYNLKIGKNFNQNVKEGISINSGKACLLKVNSLNIESASDIVISADKSIELKVGGTSIIIDSSSVLIKSGGVKSLFDSQGCLVKGGKIKAE